MTGTKQLAEKINQICVDSKEIDQRVHDSPEPLRTMMYCALGDEIASAIDGSDLYHEIVDELEKIY